MTDRDTNFVPDPTPVRPPFLDFAAPYVHTGGWILFSVALAVFLTSLRYRRPLGHNFAAATGLSLIAICIVIACQLF